MQSEIMTDRECVARMVVGYIGDLVEIANAGCKLHPPPEHLRQRFKDKLGWLLRVKPVFSSLTHRRNQSDSPTLELKTLMARVKTVAGSSSIPTITTPTIEDVMVWLYGSPSNLQPSYNAIRQTVSVLLVDGWLTFHPQLRGNKLVEDIKIYLEAIDHQYTES